MNRGVKVLIELALVLLGTIVLSSCGRDKVSMAFMPVGKTYPAATVTAFDKIDVLFVIDNSGSMAEEQSTLGLSMNSFMSNFISKGYDFQVGVSTTEAYLNGKEALKKIPAAPPNVALPTASGQNGNLGCISDGGYGLIATPCTGNVSIVTAATANTVNTLVANAVVGTNGNSTERGLMSTVTTLKAAANSGFLRADSFLAVVIISDVDDTDTNSVSCYLDNTGTCVAPGGSTYTPAGGFNLDAITASSGISRRYNISTIFYNGESLPCAGESQGTPSPRYASLAGLTNGVGASICNNFATSLSNIQAQITTLATQFFLSRVPKVSTIYVAFDGVVVPNNATNGWTYDSVSNSIQFHGTWTPTSGTNIFIDFVPAQ